MVDGGVNRWCILATRKTHPRMSPRGSEFREPQGYLPGPLPANKWSRRTTMMNCEFGSSPVCLQLPASVPTYVSGRGGGRGNVESIESDSYVLQTSPDHSGRNSRSDSTGRRGVPRGVHRRRGGGYHRVGGGGGVGDPPLRSPPGGGGGGGGGGGRDPPPRVLYKIPLMAHLHGKRFKFPPMMLKHLPLTSINP